MLKLKLLFGFSLFSLLVQCCSGWGNLEHVSRRSFLATATIPVAVSFADPARADTVATLINELNESRDKLKAIPDLLQREEWDKVRSILKVPPVNKLWNLGDVSCVRPFRSIYIHCKDDNVSIVKPPIFCCWSHKIQFYRLQKKQGMWSFSN